MHVARACSPTSAPGHIACALGHSEVSQASVRMAAAPVHSRDNSGCPAPSPCEEGLSKRTVG
eukprot:3275078-Amphidinium_carterae.1